MSETKSKTVVWLLLTAVTIGLVGRPSSSATDTFIYGGCSRLKFSPGTGYESNLNSLLTSIVSSAAVNNYNNFTVKQNGDTVYGLFQCRGDLTPSTCASCVSRAVTQLGSICLDACGGVLQLEGCFVRYDNVSFVGAEEKTLVLKQCGPSTGFDGQDALAVMGYLGSNGGAYRVGGSGGVQGMAQCVGDLSPSECQDCLSDAIGRLRSDCGMARWANLYLAKCYARYSSGGSHARQSPASGDGSGNDETLQKTLAIIIGLIAGVMLLVVFLSFLGKQFRKLQEGK